MEKLLNDLRALGICEGDIVLVHSSFRSLGYVEDGIAGLIADLIKVLGPSGTLLIPTLSYAYITMENPVFDVRKTKACIGAVPEYFRQMDGVHRSLCPTHSVAAIGHDAEDITAQQLLDHTPVGLHSPFRKLSECGGKILMLGCGLEPNTSMHGVEELVEPPYLYLPGDYPFTVVDENGIAHDIRMKRHNFQKGNMIYQQRYDRVLDLIPNDKWNERKVLNADSFLIDASTLWLAAEKKYQEDPMYFVDLVPNQE